MPKATNGKLSTRPGTPDHGAVVAAGARWPDDPRQAPTRSPPVAAGVPFQAIDPLHEGAGRVPDAGQPPLSDDGLTR
eukprot:3264896-Alexandrium_andersonii.AAC.1